MSRDFNRLAMTVEYNVEEFLKHSNTLFSPLEIEEIFRDIADAFAMEGVDHVEGCPGGLGNAANRLSWEEYGAPRSPAIGDLFTAHGDTVEFDGKRWRHVGV